MAATVRHHSSPVIRDAKRVLAIEARSLTAMAGRIGSPFLRAVDLMHACRGRVVITGLGKSGLIGQKIAATLASTGTPSIFLHAAEAIHGDLGILIRDDLVIAISNSGSTDEVLRLLPPIKRMGLPLIAMTGNLKSPLAKHAEVVLDVSVEEEACPHNLAPTASTTAVLAMGDALAVSLMNRRGFKPEDFSRLHPGGALGRRFIKIQDIMHTGKQLPKITFQAKVSEAVREMSRKKFGCVGVVDARGRLVGIFTDGDLRRALENNPMPTDLPIGEVMTRKPVVVRQDELAIKAVRIMQDKRIFVLLAVDPVGRLAGIVHFLDLFDAGVV